MKPDFTEDLGHLKRLVADLKRLEAAAPAIMGGPVLHHWMPNFQVVSCIEGTVEGHPAHPDGARVRTSQLFALFQARGESFARTLNWWYRLGMEGVR